MCSPILYRFVDGYSRQTAKLHGLTFVTRNTGDVKATGVPLLNPFEPAS